MRSITFYFLWKILGKWKITQLCSQFPFYNNFFFSQQKGNKKFKKIVKCKKLNETCWRVLNIAYKSVSSTNIQILILTYVVLFQTTLNFIWKWKLLKFLQQKPIAMNSLYTSVNISSSRSRTFLMILNFRYFWCILSLKTNVKIC